MDTKKTLDGRRREANGIDSAFTPQVDAEIARLFADTPSDADAWDSQLESDVTDGKPTIFVAKHSVSTGRVARSRCESTSDSCAAIGPPANLHATEFTNAPRATSGRCQTRGIVTGSSPASRVITVIVFVPVR